MNTLTFGGNRFEYDAGTGKSVYQILLDNDVLIPSYCGGNGTCGKCNVRLISGILNGADGKLVDEGCEVPACMSFPAGNVVIEPIAVRSGMVTSKAKEFDKESGLNGNVGVAVDVGTTTIGTYFYSLSDNELIYSCSGCNLQASYGADVISRLNYVSYEPDGLNELKDIIIRQINGFIKESGIEKNSITDFVFVGNTVMQHILAGINPRTIGEYPYTPESFFGIELNAKDLGLKCSDDAVAYFAPCLSGFVGGDVTAGLLFCEKALQDAVSLYIDIGTNGEIALVNKGKITAASTAAGPALEGGHISCGMCMEEGAIHSVSHDGEISSLGNCEPVGICGSALIDAMAYMLINGKIKSDGRINGGADRIFITDRVFITQKDIREIQLAKAAISAGIICLMNEANVTFDSLDKVIVTGGFGAGISTSNACKIGLIPKELENKTMIVGNAAGEGAIKLLLDKSNRIKIMDIVSSGKYLELSDVTVFVEEFIDRMAFSDT